MFCSIANLFCRLRETVPLHRISTCRARVFGDLPPHLLNMGGQCGAGSRRRTRGKRRLRVIFHTQLSKLREVLTANTGSRKELEVAGVTMMGCSPHLALVTAMDTRDEISAQRGASARGWGREGDHVCRALCHAQVALAGSSALFPSSRCRTSHKTSANTVTRACLDGAYPGWLRARADIFRAVR